MAVGEERRLALSHNGRRAVDGGIVSARDLSSTRPPVFREICPLMKKSQVFYRQLGPLVKGALRAKSARALQTFGK